MSRGRGRGRGRGRQFGGMESLIPGEPPPPPILTPPPLFPPMEKRPLELRKTKFDAYLLSIKQDLRHYMQQSPFALKASSGKKEIERYSDKYKQFKGSEVDNFIEWNPDWKFFPSELQIGVKQRKRASTFRPTLPAQKRVRRSSKHKENGGSMGKEDVGTSSDVVSGVKKVTFAEESIGDERFDPLAKLDETTVQVKEEGEEGEEGEEEALVEEFYDEEIEEEDTDYNATYFDNGEDYGGDEEDALDDGPYY